ncbi:MAG: ricin-type beta-trefoil lectin domain protein [Lewinellaceae bacterium]|nr:ricin-type beta-trefoil lectin domain protein [Lewinellaceae bacterium]
MKKLKNQFKTGKYLFLYCLLLSAIAAIGQPSLNMGNTTFTYVESDANHYYDYILPLNVTSKILYAYVRGGDGGAGNNVGKGGGGGAELWALIPIGSNPGELKPGSTLRFIPGGNGRSRGQFGSGGGGSAIAWRGKDSTNWHILMVAGGGGGAGKYHTGSSANTWENGYGSGDDPANAGKYSSATSAGGTDGMGAIDGNTDGGAGGGAYGSGLHAYDKGGSSHPTGYEKKDSDGAAGMNAAGAPVGGASGGDSEFYIDGGYGFGGGGSGYNEGWNRAGAGGGGGGYSGGGGGGEGYNGGGAGSFIDNTYLKPAFTLQWINAPTMTPRTGEITVCGVSSLERAMETYPFPYTLHTIQLNKALNKCIDNRAGGLQNGNNILLWDCQDNNPNQVWILTNSEIHLANHTDKCLDLNNSNTANGTNIQLWDCNGTDAQKWVYDGLTKNIRSKVNSEKCLDLVNGITSNGNNIQLWDCKEIGAQQWAIDGATTVSNVSNKKHIVPVLAPNFAVHSHTGEQYGSNIQLWTKDDTNTAEQWYFNGLVIKMLVNHNLCIDLSNSNTNNGNNIQLWGCNGTNAQKWIYDGMTKSIRSVINPAKCMQIEKNTDGVYGKRSNVDIQDCNGSTAQQFLIQE